jgi:hypothetical protein
VVLSADASVVVLAAIKDKKVAAQRKVVVVSNI